MSVQLSHEHFAYLTRLVQNLPDFATVRDRRRLVVGALAGASRADVVLARLDLDGPPMGVAVEVAGAICATPARPWPRCWPTCAPMRRRSMPA